MLRGSCLCGGAAYEVTGPIRVVHNCHCSRCRKARAAAHTTNGFTAMEDVRYTRGGDALRTYRLPEARHFSQVFCPTCGSGMPRRDPERGIAVIPFGSLDDDPGRGADDHIFVASKAPWHEITDDLPRFDETPGVAGIMALPLDDTVRIGITSRLATPEEVRETVALAEDVGLDSLWCGEHVAYTSPILDPFVRLSYAAAVSESLTLGTCVYLVPLRPAAAIAKQVVSIDHLSGGRFVFGAGVGGEFPGEFDACGVPVRERGARLDEAIDVMRALWTGEPVSFRGRFVEFEDVRMQPPPLAPGGPPIWCGARQEPALRRIGRKADGWVSYVVTPQRYAEGLETIEAAAREANRTIERFDSAHLLFARIDDSRDRALDDATAILSRRYAMDFRRAAERYCALGHPEEVAATVNEFLRAGVRHVILDLLGDWDESRPQLERFCEEVRPKLRIDSG